MEVKLLNLVFLLGLVCGGADAAEFSCSRKIPPKNVAVIDGQGLGPLLESTRQSRKSIFNQELPYASILLEISKV